MMAIERGRLADCIFDNRAHLSHRAMAAILGVILRLPPTAQVLATEQFRSRYLARILEHVRVCSAHRQIRRAAVYVLPSVGCRRVPEEGRAPAPRTRPW